MFSGSLATSLSPQSKQALLSPFSLPFNTLVQQHRPAATLADCLRLLDSLDTLVPVGEVYHHIRRLASDLWLTTELVQLIHVNLPLWELLKDDRSLGTGASSNLFKPAASNPRNQHHVSSISCNQFLQTISINLALLSTTWTSSILDAKRMKKM